MKKTFLAAAAAVVAVTSVIVGTAVNAEDKIDGTQKVQIMETSAAVNSLAAMEVNTTAAPEKKTAQLEYKKTLFTFQDSGETILTETWMDPETLEYRTNEIDTSGGGKVEKNFTFFTKDGASHHLNIFRDENGKPVSGEEFYYPKETADNNADDLRNFDTFAGSKAMYQDTAFWTDKGTVTADGKTLKKLLCGNEKEGNTTLVYIDETTGFPVKQESFENGKQVSTMTYEFQYVDRDEKLFDANAEGVTYELRDIGNEAQKLKELKTKLDGK